MEVEESVQSNEQFADLIVAEDGEVDFPNPPPKIPRLNPSSPSAV